MRQIFIYVLILGLAVWWAGCGSPTEPTSKEYRFEDFAQIDTTDYFYTKYHPYFEFTPDRTWKEPVMNWEQSLGEPFFDLNGNGIYEPEIDSFVRALDFAVNQDLNRNNEYDGPNEPWEPGIPFDDVNGDDVYNPQTGNDQIGYLSGRPFCDLNCNGIYDTSIIAYYAPLKWIAIPLDSARVLYRAYYQYVDYYFESDSGCTYNMRIQNSVQFPQLIGSAEGLYIELPYDMVIDNIPMTLFYMAPILDAGMVHRAQDEEIIVYDVFDMPKTIHRTIERGVSTVHDGYRYDDIVRVTLWYEEAPVDRYVFCFARDVGLIFYGEGDITPTPAQGDLLNFRKFSFVYDRLPGTDSLVFPMTR